MKNKIMLVGEAWGAEEEKAGKPFVGSSGQVLDSMLRAAGIERRECYLTNVFNFRPPNNALDALAGPKSECLPGFPQLGKLWIHRNLAPELNRLWQEVRDIQPNVVVTLGATPLWALTHAQGITKLRGTPMLTNPNLGAFKVLPTLHPAYILRNWSSRPVVIADLVKVREQSAFPELRRPQRTVLVPETIEELRELFFTHLDPAEYLSADIETKQETITEIGFAPSESLAVVIPFWCRERHNYWPTLSEELEAWSIVRQACLKPLLGQNFNYDIQYLFGKMGIATPRLRGDTMILHHSLYPEMEKSLGFLGSLYTAEPSWKTMRTDSETLKQED